MRNYRFILLLTLLCPPLASAGTDKDARFLPSSFNGWQEGTDSLVNSDPSSVDPADAAILKEYGFSSVEVATFTRSDRKMQIKAARFNDATGAYGAFTYYQQPQMQTEKIGDEGASNNTRILFYRGNFLVDVSLDRVTAMSAADLRALADALPQIHGSSAKPPNLPNNLPQKLYIPHTARYIVGPVASERLGVPIPPPLIGFDRSAELVEGKYRSTWGEANLLLIGYPTPQIAALKLREIQAAALPGGPFYFKRSGPIVVVVNGNVPADEAQTLLASVNYDAEVTLNQPTKQNPRDNIGNLIIGIFVLIGFITLLALIFGFAFGGIRILAKKLFPDKVFDRPEDVEIIRLNLK
ncbi:MAG TPA: DUF6599 family protein [Candidatus Angelobacter sp.]